jgi:hypothetical protein
MTAIDALRPRRIALGVMISLIVCFQLYKSFNVLEDLTPAMFRPAIDQTAENTNMREGNLSRPSSADGATGNTTIGAFVNTSGTSHFQPLEPDVVRRLLNPPPTNRTMNACVLIMDDTIRLIEWLAYHYTVLPLGHLMVAIDPNSKRLDKIDRILNDWREYITIDAYYNDSFLTLDPHEGWGRRVRGARNRTLRWLRNENGTIFRSQAHKRRQNFFSGFCFRELYEKNKRDWTLLTDTDEYVTFNYRYPETEDPTIYDSETDQKSLADVDIERARLLPFRDLLANMTERVTIAQYLETYEGIVSGSESRPNYCIRIPGLTFSSLESDPVDMARDFATGMDGNNLMTLRQRQHAAKDGSFSKAMLHLRTANGSDWFDRSSVYNVHSPNKRMCGVKKFPSGSGADYISSLFRIHHYRAGTVEAYLERAGDWRGAELLRYFDRNVESVGNNTDLTHWFKWFVDKVGKEAADRLLIQPLNETYNEIGNLRRITEAKENISRHVPSLFVQQEPANYSWANLTIGA